MQARGLGQHPALYAKANDTLSIAGHNLVMKVYVSIGLHGKKVAIADGMEVQGVMGIVGEDLDNNPF